MARLECFWNLYQMRILALFGASQATETSLTLLDVKEENVREIELAPMKIKVFQLQ